MSITRQILLDAPGAYWPLRGDIKGLVAAGGDLTLAHGANTFVSDPLMGQAADATAGDWTTTYRVAQTAYTLESWCYPTGPNTDDDTLLADWGGDAATGVMLWRDPTNHFATLQHAGVAVVGPALASNVWHQVLGRWTGTTLELYVDGAKVASAANSTAPGTAAGSGALSRLNNYGSYLANRAFVGRLAHCAWWNVALTPDRILAHYRAGRRQGTVGP